MGGKVCLLPLYHLLQSRQLLPHPPCSLLLMFIGLCIWVLAPCFCQSFVCIYFPFSLQKTRYVPNFKEDEYSWAFSFLFTTSFPLCIDVFFFYIVSKAPAPFCLACFVLLICMKNPQIKLYSHRRMNSAVMVESLVTTHHCFAVIKERD